MKKILCCLLLILFGCDTKKIEVSEQKEKKLESDTKIPLQNKNPTASVSDQNPIKWFQGKGIEYRAKILQQKITTNKVPMIVYFQNKSDKDVSHRSIKDYYRSHGEVKMIDFNGKEMLIYSCKKKHAYESMIYKPNEIRQYQLDLLRLSCMRLQRSLTKGRYFVKFGEQHLEFFIDK